MGAQDEEHTQGCIWSQRADYSGMKMEREMKKGK